MFDFTCFFNFGGNAHFNWEILCAHTYCFYFPHYFNLPFITCLRLMILALFPSFKDLKSYSCGSDLSLLSYWGVECPSLCPASVVCCNFWSHSFDPVLMLPYLLKFLVFQTYIKVDYSDLCPLGGFKQMIHYWESLPLSVHSLGDQQAWHCSCARCSQYLCCSWLTKICKLGLEPP